MSLDYFGVAPPRALVAELPISWPATALALGAGALGAWVHRDKHPVLAALGWSALASNAHAVATGGRTWRNAARRMGGHLVAVTGSLQLHKHPALGYVTGAIVAEILLDDQGGGIVEEWAHYAGVRERPVEVIEAIPTRETSSSKGR